MSDELREKVGLLFCKNDRDCMGFKYCNPGCQTKADAAIALARDATLEEAAKVVREALEEHGDPLAKDAALRAIGALKGKP
jgi:hypothetical protein